VREDIASIKEAIDRLTYADLFMAITNMPGVQPRNVEELLKRDEEKLTQIGPVVEMVNDDMLPMAVERMIGIAQRGGLLDDLNPPEELQGRELKFKFVSVLAQAQKMLGLSTTERVVGFVGSLGQVFGPQVLDKIDPDEIIDDYAERANLPQWHSRPRTAGGLVRDKASVGDRNPLSRAMTAAGSTARGNLYGAKLAADGMEAARASPVHRPPNAPTPRMGRRGSCMMGLEVRS
jgi:hypothetical protein